MNHQKIAHSDSCTKPHHVVHQSANHKRAANHNEMMFGQHSMQIEKGNNQVSVRTPSSSNIERGNNKISVDLQNQLAGKKTMVNHPNALGSISHEGGPLHEIDKEGTRVMHGSEQSRKNKNGDTMLPRFRNASEIGDIRSNSKMQGNNVFST